MPDVSFSCCGVCLCVFSSVNAGTCVVRVTMKIGILKMTVVQHKLLMTYHVIKKKKQSVFQDFNPLILTSFDAKGRLGFTDPIISAPNPVCDSIWGSDYIFGLKPKVKSQWLIGHQMLLSSYFI